MTTLVYNDVVMRDCETKSFKQDVEYDLSGTDVIYSRFTIRVASNVIALRQVTGEAEFGITTTHGTTVVQKMHDIQARLSEARKDFWMLIDDCPISESNGANTLNQPLLVACGKAWDETIATQTVGSGANLYTQSYIQRSQLDMYPHPFDTAAATRRYGTGAQFNKAFALDCDNGPKPRNLSVEKIIGGRSIRVEFEIEVCLKICPEGFTDSAPVMLGGNITSDNRILSNRWHLEETKDENWVTTRSLQGTLRVAHSSYWPHAMRFLCVPTLLKGYKRISQSYVSDPTDLVLKYRVDDQQAHAAPPWPAIKWSGHHTEAGTSAGGVIKTSEVQVRLQGPPGIDKQLLIGAAGKVITNRIKGLRKPTIPVNRSHTILKNVSIVDVLDQPIIEMRVQVQHSEKDADKGLLLRIKSMGTPITDDGNNDAYSIDGYSPDVWPVPLPYDSSRPAGIFSCYLQHPCSVWHDMPNGIAPGDESPPPDRPPVSTDDRYGDYRETESPTPLPDNDSAYDDSEDKLDFPYTYYELQNEYKVNQGVIGMPRADSRTDLAVTQSIIQLHAPTARRILTVTASRNGKPPILPTLQPVLTDPNGYKEVLEGWAPITKAPKIEADGYSRIFELKAVYSYLMERAPGPSDILRVGSTPLDLFSPNSNWINLGTAVDADGHLQYESGTTVTFPT
jgi:hypothetical protein